MKLITAHSIAVDIMAQIKDDGQKYLHRVIRLTTRAVEQLNIKYIPRVKTEIFELSSAYTVVLPEYSMRPLKVGKLSDDLKKWNPIELCGSMYSPAQITGCTCGETEATPCVAHTLNNCMFSEYSCIGGGSLYVGEAKWSPTNNTLYFNSKGLSTDDIIAVEYEASEDDQAYMIPFVLREAVIQRVLQWWTQDRPGVSEYHLRQFRIELHEAQRMAETGSYDDYIKAICGRSMPRVFYAGKAPKQTYIDRDIVVINPETTTLPGGFFGNAAAIANGVLPGQQYWLSLENEFGLPEGAVMVAVEI